MNKIIKLILVIGLATLSQISLAQEGRGYSSELVKQGAQLFQQNCAGCHGVNAASVTNWQQKGEDGKYSPPPLDGTAHTWHHSPNQLKKTIQQGGIQLGGSMPPFSAILNDAEMDAVIAYFQSKWPDDIYSKWAERFRMAAVTTDQPDITQLLKLRLISVRFRAFSKSTISPINT